jgi:hypothetical protein
MNHRSFIIGMFSNEVLQGISESSLARLRKIFRSCSQEDQRFILNELDTIKPGVGNEIRPVFQTGLSERVAGSEEISFEDFLLLVRGAPEVLSQNASIAQDFLNCKNKAQALQPLARNGCRRTWAAHAGST